MDDRQIHETIRDLVAEEHRLRASGHGLSEDELVRLDVLEVQLDQCWDLLRQRDALRRAGRDPDTARPRSAGEIESYLQ